MSLRRVREGTTVDSELKGSLEGCLKALQDLNSLFPETKRFLGSKQVEHIDQLDPESLSELQIHLETEYRRLLQ